MLLFLTIFIFQYFYLILVFVLKLVTNIASVRHTRGLFPAYVNNHNIYTDLFKAQEMNFHIWLRGYVQRRIFILDGKSAFIFILPDEVWPVQYVVLIHFNF